jgi:lantibiotic leader peptide-processing serine protease
VRRILVSALVALTAAALAAPTSAGAGPGRQAQREYIVLYSEGASLAAARAGVAAAGGTLVRENQAVGVATVRSSRSDFASVAARSAAIAGVAGNRSIGSAPSGSGARQKPNQLEKLGRVRGASAAGKPTRALRAEPLAPLQWDMRQIDATARGSYKVERGERGVRVGIMDTGIDGSHPDVAPNFSRRLSRNFTVDIPVDANGNEIDGPCAEEPDNSCTDPADVDEDGHGTHVASTVGSPLNGLGIGGVAPKVTLVNVRAGQDSGFFFLQPTVDALTYSGDVGIDVVNMSFYVDPWLFNCLNNPADAPEDQAEQRTIIAAMQRALNYAHRHGVTLVSAAGNGSTDYTKPSIDPTSPDFADEPGEAPYERTIDPDTCTSMPSEGRHVITVSATGPSTRKAFYSDYGYGYVDVAAPGGDTFDNPSNTNDDTLGILAAYPRALAIANEELNPDGTPAVPWVVRDCKGSVCAYYQYLQGTSMASPHAAGVAALIVSKFGRRDRHGGGLTLDPDATERRLLRTAVNHPCPSPRTYTYTLLIPNDEGELEEITLTATCEGPRFDNGFYGEGIVNALRAVRR